MLKKQPMEPSTPSPQTQHPQTPLHHLQNSFSNFFKHLACTSLQPPPTPPSHFHLNPTSLQLSLNTLIQNSIHTVQSAFSTFTSTSSPPQHHFANLSFTHNQPKIKPPHHCFDLAMATEEIEERLAGVPVYALSNANEEFVLISGVKTGKALGLFCFNKDDADMILEQMRTMDPRMRGNSKVVAVALNKVFQLQLSGVAFRFIPDSSQIKNAIKVKKSVGPAEDGFTGVPVFQSESLVLKNENKRYRPIFFRQEDLEDSLRRASVQQKKVNPALRPGDIQVSVLEEIIKTMKETKTSKWDDVVFIPPGFDVSAGVPRQEERVSANA